LYKPTEHILKHIQLNIWKMEHTITRITAILPNIC